MKTENLALLIITGLGVAWYLKNEVIETATKVGQAVNPVNNENIFYGGVNSVGVALTSNVNWTLGGWLFEVFNEEPKI